MGRWSSVVVGSFIVERGGWERQTKQEEREREREREKERGKKKKKSRVREKNVYVCEREKEKSKHMQLSKQASRRSREKRVMRNWLKKVWYFCFLCFRIANFNTLLSHNNDIHGFGKKKTKHGVSKKRTRRGMWDGVSSTECRPGAARDSSARCHLPPAQYPCDAAPSHCVEHSIWTQRRKRKQTNKQNKTSHKTELEHGFLYQSMLKPRNHSVKDSI
jgi:hypothetical protein